MHNQLNDKLLSAIKQHSPDGNNLVSILMEMFSLGKEAIYRRLRGEVPFTLEEAMKISRRFGISLDLISKLENNTEDINWVTFDLNLFYNPQNYFEKHCEKLELFSTVFKEMQGAKKVTLRGAYSFMPYTFLFPYKKLSQFRHYKWNYLSQGVNPNFVFSDMHVPPHVLEMEKTILSEIHLIPKIVFILDKNVFSSLLNDIVYFYQRNLISETEILELKEELLSLVTFLEELNANGTFCNDTEVNMFLSEIELGSSCTHMEYDDKELCLNWAYFIDIFSCYNGRLNKKQKEWIELLKRYSIPITKSGEVQRFDFFNKQRKLINELI